MKVDECFGGNVGHFDVLLMLILYNMSSLFTYPITFTMVRSIIIMNKIRIRMIIAHQDIEKGR